MSGAIPASTGRRTRAHSGLLHSLRVRARGSEIPASGDHAPVTLRHLVRSTTRGAHERLERELNLEQGQWTLETYAGFLRATLAVVEQAEPHIAVALRPYFPISDGGPTATSRLNADLLALGARDRPASQPRLPEIKATAEAFGAAYVLEGSRLGGQVIAAALTRQLGIGDEHLSYLCPSGVAVGPRWRAFVDALDDYGRTVDRAEWDTVAGTANEMFGAFREAFMQERILVDRIN